MNDLFEPHTRALIVPRDYQSGAHDNFFVLWDSGTIGALARMFTGAGKTLTASLGADTWMQRSGTHRVLVVSYERQLVWQFAQEIKDYIGLEPGVEMDREAIDAERIPRITVASRQSLLPKTPATDAQVQELTERGVNFLVACTEEMARSYIKQLRKGRNPEDVRDDIEARSAEPEVYEGIRSRLHKFDWQLPWLVIFDEAHRHAYHLPSVSHIVDWFERNPQHRRLGLTATPKRSDGVSIGAKMFPGVACDFPLYATEKPCAVTEGYAVPYVQRYIEVEGVDFKNIARVSKSADADFDEKALEAALNEEATLAKLCGPLLDMVGDRRTLIFSPGVGMAANVARFINARVPTRCDCGVVKWHSRALIGDGSTCECGVFIDKKHVLRPDDQARSISGDTDIEERREVYRGHQAGKFQFLSVCGLCREGYNDPDISCVAVFRPVRKEASSLAEQMKGRACRPMRSLANRLHTLPDAEARRKAIAESEKPNALIVDLVGITGLADCASTVQIYAEGLPDEVQERAAEILADESTGQEIDVQSAIVQAKEELAAAKEKARLEREEAERKAKEEFDRRALAEAQAKYTAHEVGYGSQAEQRSPHLVTEKQLRFIARLGMAITKEISKKQAGRIIDMLRRREPCAAIAMKNNLNEEDWTFSEPSDKQKWFARKNGVSVEKAETPFELSQLIDAKIKPADYEAGKRDEIGRAKNDGELTALGMDLRLVHGVLPEDAWRRLADLGKQRRAALATPAQDNGTSDEPIPY